MRQDFVLHPYIVTHPEFMTCLEVEQEEIGFSRLEKGVDGAASPVYEHLRGVEQRHLQREAPQGVHLGVCTLFLVGDDVLVVHLELLSCLPGLFGHVFQPSDDGHAVGGVVAVVCESLAGVLRRIIGQRGSGDGAACHGLSVIDGDGAQPLFHLAHLHHLDI